MDNDDATSGPPQLDSVHAFDVAGDFEGGRWWVTAVERWRDATSLQYVVWTRESKLNNPPSHMPGGGYQGFVVSLTDDLGTAYHYAGGGSGGGEHLTRGHQEFATLLPSAARSLVATLQRLPMGTPETQSISSITLDLGLTST